MVVIWVICVWIRLVNLSRSTFTKQPCAKASAGMEARAPCELGKEPKRPTLWARFPGSAFSRSALTVSEPRFSTSTSTFLLTPSPSPRGHTRLDCRKACNLDLPPLLVSAPQFGSTPGHLQNADARPSVAAYYTFYSTRRAVSNATCVFSHDVDLEDIP